jgi:hypothetical protein
VGGLAGSIESEKENTRDSEREGQEGRRGQEGLFSAEVALKINKT